MSSFISNLSHRQFPKRHVHRLYVIIGVGGVGKATKSIANIYSHLAMDKRTKWFIGDFDKSDLNKQIMHIKLLDKDYMRTLFHSLIKSIHSDRIVKTNQFNDFFQNSINRMLKELFPPIELKRWYMSKYVNEKKNKDYKNGKKMVSIYKKWNDVSIIQKACAVLFIHDLTSFCRKQSALGIEANQFLIFSAIPRFRLFSNKV